MKFLKSSILWLQQENGQMLTLIKPLDVTFPFDKQFLQES